MMEKKKIQTFADLDAWKEGHQVVLVIYQITKSFPKDEIFGLTNQMRRASVSFTSNIAEGFSRQSYKEKLQFYCMSLGSLTELQSQLFVAKDVGYISNEEFVTIYEQTVKVHKITTGLVKYSKTIIHNS